MRTVIQSKLFHLVAGRRCSASAVNVFFTYEVKEREADNSLTEIGTKGNLVRSKKAEDPTRVS